MSNGNVSQNELVRPANKFGSHRAKILASCFFNVCFIEVHNFLGYPLSSRVKIFIEINLLAKKSQAFL